MTEEQLTAAHKAIDAVLAEWRNAIETTLLDLAERGHEPTEEACLAQLMMERLTAVPLDPEDEGPDTRAGGGIAVLTENNKVRLVRMAHHMGPDYAQAIYRAAVFLTKTA